jgi:sugar phosphate isomerase/epimerase
MTWRIGLATGCCTDHPILDVLDAAEEAGYPGVEFGTPPRHFSPWDPEEVEAVARRLPSLPCAPVSMHAPFGGLLDLANADAHERDVAIGRILTAAKALRHLGGTLLVVHPTDYSRGHHDVEPRLACAADALRRLIEATSTFGVTVAIETPLPHLIGGHPDEFASLLQRVGPAARVCLDTGHTYLGRFTRRFVELAGERLVHVHAHDNHGHFDDHLAPGDGEIDWPAIVTMLDDAKYAGWIILELKCPDTPMAEYFRRARRQAEHLLNGVIAAPHGSTTNEIGELPKASAVAPKRR